MKKALTMKKFLQTSALTLGFGLAIVCLDANISPALAIKVELPDGCKDKKIRIALVNSDLKLLGTSETITLQSASKEIPLEEEIPSTFNQAMGEQEANQVVGAQGGRILLTVYNKGSFITNLVLLRDIQDSVADKEKPTVDILNNDFKIVFDLCPEPEMRFKFRIVKAR